MDIIKELLYSVLGTCLEKQNETNIWRVEYFGSNPVKTYHREVINKRIVVITEQKPGWIMRKIIKYEESITIFMANTWNIWKYVKRIDGRNADWWDYTPTDFDYEEYIPERKDCECLEYLDHPLVNFISKYEINLKPTTFTYEGRLLDYPKK